MKYLNLTHENLEKHNNELQEEYSVINNVKEENDNKSEKRTSSTCSSRTSHTSNGGRGVKKMKMSDESSLESCENSQMSEYSSLSEENIYAIIKNFPVQIICLEKMDRYIRFFIR